MPLSSRRAARHHAAVQLALILALASAAPDCQAFADRVGVPLQVTTAPITAAQLDLRRMEGAPQPGASGGLLEYQGRGIEIRSADPRFDGVEARPGSFRHRCGYVLPGPTGWNALDSHRTDRMLRFERDADGEQAPPGAVAAAQIGAVPVVPGATPGPAWPVWVGSRKIFIGAMRLAARPDESVIVAFPDRPGPTPAVALARVRMDVQGLSIVPGLHVPGSYISLFERTSDGVLRHVVLEMSTAAANTIAQRLNP